jgi:glutamine synthetase
MPATTAKPEEILARIKADGVKFINLQFTDILGMIKSAPIPVARLGEAIEKGLWFDGSSVEGFGRIYESDMVLHPDLNTYAVFPWTPAERRVARIICDVHDPDGKPFAGDPRNILKLALAECEALGYTFHTGAELEFFLFRKNGEKVSPLPHDVGGYFDMSPRDLAADVREEIALALSEMNMEVEMVHHEVAHGQHEIDVRYADALTCADNVMTTKLGVKSIAQAHDLYATFMPKPLFGINGSGMHTHQSLFDAKGKNAFHSASDPYHLSKLAYGFIAGQLAHAKGMTAIVAPTVNSYKRLVPGYEAPVYICWGQINRSALIRIPRYSPGRESATRAELRYPDPACNPYLAFACMLRAGLDGVKRGLTPPKPVEENVYHFNDARLAELNIDTLPGSLSQALDLMEQDPLIAETLGAHTYPRFLEAKRQEWDQYRIRVTDWEIDRYLEIL